ncbi:MAG: RluA family pseudouridine synthase [Clostridia bacterium]|nr:RluA family pseudouridine synthase [Clostridia bacterium]
MSELEFICTEKCDRVDAFLASTGQFTRSAAAKLCDDGRVSINGKEAKKKSSLNVGDRIIVHVPAPVDSTAKPQEIPLNIVYEDDDLLVVNKPKGMVVHPAPGNADGTLVNALLAHCGDSLSGINGVIRPGIVHRIDKDTSGLLIVAKNDRAHTHLAAQIKEHSFTREYEAVVYGNVKEDEGIVDAPIGRHPTKRKQMAVTTKASRNAVTHWRVVNRYGKFTHLALRLETGRTHQIRVHMSYIGHAVAGDSVYGPKKVIERLGGQCLHAKKIGFIHPDGRYLEFDSPLPEYFTSFLKGLENEKI